MTARKSSSKSSGMTYRDAGVDVDAGNAFVKAIAPLAAGSARTGVIGGIGGFGGLFDPKAAGFDDPILVAATDGVGTKLKIAIDTGRHDTIGIDLVAMCVNDLIVQGAEPLFFLDYFACAKLEPATAEAVVAGIARGCEMAGAALIGGETAEMPGLYGEGDYDLAGFAVGAAERGQLLPRQDLSEGDVLIGLASSGAHSNGYSLLRRIIADQKLDWQAPAPFAPDQSLAEVCIAPTRIYVKPLLDAIRKTSAVKALAHITGGGLSENIPRILPAGLGARLDLASLTVPPLFRWLAAAGDIAADEMLRTFNLGTGMVVAAAADDADPLIGVLEAAGESPRQIGVLEAVENDAQMAFSGALELA